MIEGRPRESLVQYENPIEVSPVNIIEQIITLISIDLGRTRPQRPLQEDLWL